MSNKLLLALQFWEKDRAQAMDLARLIADIQPSFCNEADFLFVNRFDCKPVDDVTLKHVARKFRVHNYKSPRRGTGWPNGCNELWFGTMEWFYHLAEAKKIPHYKAALTFEADCVPLNRDWISLFSHNWDLLNVATKAYIVGKILESEHIHQHINGNCMVSGDFKFLKWLVKRVGSAPPNVGWDYCMAGDFRSWGWAEMPGMECMWNTKTLSTENLDALCDRGVIFLHGVKDNSALLYSRNKFV